MVRSEESEEELRIVRLDTQTAKSAAGLSSLLFLEEDETTHLPASQPVPGKKPECSVILGRLKRDSRVPDRIQIRAVVGKDKGSQEVGERCVLVDGEMFGAEEKRLRVQHESRRRRKQEEKARSLLNLIMQPYQGKLGDRKRRQQLLGDAIDPEERKS